MDDLHGERERGDVIDGQLPVAEVAHLLGNPVLEIALVAQCPQRVGERRRGCVASDEEHREVADPLVVGQRPAGVGVPRRQQQPHQFAVQGWIGPVAGDRLLDHGVNLGQRSTESAPRGGGQGLGGANGSQSPAGGVVQHLLDVRSEIRSVFVEVHAEHGSTQHPQGEAPHVLVDVDPRPVDPVAARSSAAAAM